MLVDVDGTESKRTQASDPRPLLHPKPARCIREQHQAIPYTPNAFWGCLTLQAENFATQNNPLGLFYLPFWRIRVLQTSTLRRRGAHEKQNKKSRTDDFRVPTISIPTCTGGYVLASSAPAHVMTKSSPQRHSAKKSCNFVLRKQRTHPKSTQ